MRGWIRSLLKILGFYVLWALLLTPVVLGVVALGGEQWDLDPMLRLGFEIGAAAAVLAALIIMALVIDKRGLSTIGFRWSAAPFGLFAGTLLGAAIFAAPVLVLLALGAARYVPNFAAFSPLLLALALAVCFFNVAMQEILVRSYPFQQVHRRHGAVAATIVTTMIFLAMHIPALIQGLHGAIAGANILIASVMLSLAYLRTRALWLPIGLHLGWNGLQGPVLGVNVTGAEIGMGGWGALEFPGDALLTGGAMGVEGGLVGLIGPTLGLIAVALWVKPRASLQAETPTDAL
jgi:hypothetical protein